MEIKQCDFCRRPHQTLGNRVCRECLIKLDEDMVKIRGYLYDHDRAGIEEVSNATGVTKKSIMYLLKEERLSIVEGDSGRDGVLTCESCKKPIDTGRMCASCKKDVMSAMQQSVSAVKLPKQETKKEEEEKSIKGSAKLQVK